MYLLALAVLNDRRGEAAHRPTDAEVADLLALQEDELREARRPDRRYPGADGEE
jgi:hypothetical protein